MYLDTILTVAATSWIMAAIPGPSVLYVVARTLQQGAKMGLASIIGLSLGSMVYISAVVLGLEHIIKQYPTAFIVIKTIGALYLIALGILAFKNSKESMAGPEEPIEQGKSPSKVIAQGIVVELLNPKAFLFYLSFMPQFVNKEAGNIQLQLILIGCTSLVTMAFSDGTYVLLASKLKGLLTQNKKMTKITNRISGSILVALGFKTIGS